MMTTADKLAYTRNAKKEIKNALIEKGVEVLDTDTFASYSEKIRNIPAGGGDTVYAVSETALNVDDKVYLNKHYYDSYEATSSVLSGKGLYSFIPYCYNNGDVVGAIDGDMYYYSYNSETKSWDLLITSSDITYSSYTTARQIENLDGVIALHFNYPRYSSSTIFNSPNNPIEAGNYIARKDLAISGYHTDYNISLNELVNPETGELGQTYSTFKSGTSLMDGYLNNIICSGNVLMITESNYYEFWDITDLTAPTLIKRATVSTGNLWVRFCTGFNVGDYLFTTTSATDYTSSNATTYIYKITDDYSLVLANDLPAEFARYLADTSTTFFYNNENNMLSIGNSTSVSLYKFTNSTFKKLSYNIPLPSFTLASGVGYCLFVSEDLKTAVISGAISSSNISLVLYKMVNNNDNWYAEDYIHSNALSLQGFATGNTNDEGLYEISTVLPKKINLTINTNVDTVVEMRGDVE